MRRGGFRVLALDPRGTVAWDAVDMTGPIAVVAGGEGTGVRRGLLEVCDLRVAIPLARGVESLNVAVAVAVVLFEVARQRRLAGREGLGIRKSMPSP